MTPIGTMVAERAVLPRIENPKLSIVVPAYNEQGNIPILATEIRGALGDAAIESYEVVFVDDGSTDATATEVRAEVEKDVRIRLLRFEKNCGLTAAMDAGLKAARGETLVVIDGDLQSDPRDIPRLLAELVDGVDCVCGYRANRRAGDGVVKVASSRVANFVRNWLTSEAIRDSGCTLRAFRRECLKNVKLWKGMHRFLPTLLKYEGYTIREVPVNHRPRKFGVSKYGVWNRVFAASYDLFAVRWMRSRTVRWKVAEDI